MFVSQAVAKAEAAMTVAAICARFDVGLAPDQVRAGFVFIRM